MHVAFLVSVPHGALDSTVCTVLRGRYLFSGSLNHAVAPRGGGATTHGFGTSLLYKTIQALQVIPYRHTLIGHSICARAMADFSVCLACWLTLKSSPIAYTAFSHALTASIPA